MQHIAYPHRFCYGWCANSQIALQMCIQGHAGGCRAAAVQCRAARGMHGCYDFLPKPDRFPRNYLLYLDIKWVTKGMLQSQTWNSKTCNTKKSRDKRTTGRSGTHDALLKDQLSNTSHTWKTLSKSPRTLRNLCLNILLAVFCKCVPSTCQPSSCIDAEAVHGLNDVGTMLPKTTSYPLTLHHINHTGIILLIYMKWPKRAKALSCTHLPFAKPCIVDLIKT